MQNAKISYCCVLIFLLYFLNLSKIKSQSTISATITNSAELPVEYANVLLYSAIDSTFKKGTITNSEGIFNLVIIQPADYYLEVSAINYLTFQSSIFQVTESSHNFSDSEIRLTDLATDLQIVEVTAQKQLFEQKLDHLRVNVADNLTVNNGTALTVLGTAPGVEIEESQEIIRLNGNNNVKIAINGKIRPVPFSVILELLRSINSDNIQNIEIYALAPARFDAEGTGGVININLKKNPKDGINGSYGLGFSQGQRPKANVSASLNFNKNKFNLYTSYSARRLLNTQTIIYDRNFQTSGDQTNIVNTNLNNTDWWLHNLSVGADYRISDKSRIGMVVQGYLRNSENNAENTSKRTVNNLLIEEFALEINERNKWRHGAINLNFEQRISDNSTLNFDFDYLKYNNDNPSDYLTTKINPDGSTEMEPTIFIEKDLPIEIFVGQINQDFKIGKKGRLETGVKGTYSDFANDTRVRRDLSGILVIDSDFSQVYNQDETILAAFGSLRLPLSAKLDGKFGLRYEYTHLNFQSQNDPERISNYDNFFPSAYLSYKIAEKQKLSVSYNRRISRPSFNQLAPFVTFLDPQTLYTGNENLVPAISNLFKADYSVRRYIFTLQYTNINQDIFQYQPIFDNTTERQTFTSLNIPQVENYSLQVSLPFEVGSRWSMQYRISGFYERTKFSEENESLNTSGFTFFSIQRIKIKDGLSLEVSGNYKTPSYYGLLRVRSRGSLNFGLQKVFKGNGGSLRFSVRDILKTNNWESDTFIPALNLAQTSVFDVENPIFSISYRNSFGSSTVQKSRNYGGGAGSEKRRVQ